VVPAGATEQRPTNWLKKPPASAFLVPQLPPSMHFLSSFTAPLAVHRGIGELPRDARAGQATAERFRLA
jgi:hypothetical protein